MHSTTLGESGVSLVETMVVLGAICIGQSGNVRGILEARNKCHHICDVFIQRPIYFIVIFTISKNYAYH